MKEKKEYKATLFLQNGKSLKVTIPRDMRFGPDDLTGKTIFRFNLRSFKKHQTAIICGSEINYIQVH